MKANLKGLGGIKGLLLMHGEKLAIVAVGLCTVLFIYYSTQLERLPNQFQADELQKRINLAKSSIDDAEWDSVVTDHPEDIRRAKDLEKSEFEIDARNYTFVGLNPEVIKATVARPDPELLRVVGVLGTGGSGLLPFLDESVMKERQLKRQAEQDKKAKEQTKQLEREQQDQTEGRGRNQRNRNRDQQGERGFAEFDPEHPDRRPVEGIGRAPGAMVQGDERIERAVWAIVVAKVPIKDQRRLYRDAFENARGGYDPQSDFPAYAGYYVERAEVRPGQPLQWLKVDVYDGQGNKIVGATGKPLPMGKGALTKLYEVIAKEWATQVPEIVDERYLDFEHILTYPLPPLLGRDWGPEVTHPDIPLAINAPPPEEEVDPTLQQPTSTLEGANDTEESGFGVRESDAGGFQGRGPGAMSGRGGYESRGMYGGMEGGYRGMDRRGQYMEGGEGRGMGMGRGYFGGGGRGAGGGTLPRGVTHWLLRFFDFSVEPGKKYKYRVQLALYDPNQGAHIDPNTLDSKAVNRLRASKKANNNKAPSPLRFAAWSDPSPTVGIPLSGSVRLAAAKAPTGKLFNDEPTATLLVEAFDLDPEGNAIHGAKEKEFRRGYVANMIEETEYLTADGRWIDKQDSFKFLTGITVVDVAGGEKMARDMQAPARVLLLDPAGELYIRSELDDSDAVNLHRQLFAKPDKRRGGRGREGDMREMPGLGGDRGRRG